MTTASGSGRASRGDRSSPDFTCRHCHARVPGAADGTRHRNHCPNCLHSLHVDRDPGDRANDCGGVMEPVAVAARRDGEWSLVHRCLRCHEVRLNRVAGDDSPLLLVALAARPMARPPFPLEHLLRLEAAVRAPTVEGD